MKTSLRYLVIFFLITVSSTVAFADTGFVFKGKIGNYPIVMTIWATAGSVVGNYYYTSQGKEKQLSMSGEPMLDVEAPIWVFKEDLNNVHNGVFVLRWDRLDNPANEEIVGVYVNIKGQTYTVNLHCIKVISNPDHC